jgi:hypothetical protein
LNIGTAIAFCWERKKAGGEREIETGVLRIKRQLVASMLAQASSDSLA